MTALLIILGIAAAIASVAAGHYARTRRVGPIAKARSFSEQQKGASIAFFIASIPGLMARPSQELMESAYTALEALRPVAAGLGLILVATAVFTLIPAVMNFLRTRQTQAEEIARARQGLNYPETPANVVENIGAAARDFDVDVDQHTPQGIANLLITTDEGRYAIYILPPEHLYKGHQAALPRAVSIAEMLDAQAILWAAPQGAPRGYKAQGHNAYVLEGRQDHLLKLIRRLDRISYSARQREKERDKKREKARAHDPIWSDVDWELAKARQDREGWERFTAQAPRHPAIQDVLFRRTEARCGRCRQAVANENDWEVIITDPDHTCRNPQSIRLVPRDSVDDVPEQMPDCAQCHYENPEWFESCISRMTIAHVPQCPPPPEKKASSLEETDMERRARLLQS